jgi:hypothetical protein
MARLWFVRHQHGSRLLSVRAFRVDLLMQELLMHSRRCWEAQGEQYCRPPRARSARGGEGKIGLDARIGADAFDRSEYGNDFRAAGDADVW